MTPLQQYVEVFRLVVLLGVLCWVTYTDLKDGKIRNEVTYSTIVLGLVLHTITDGFQGLTTGLTGILAGGGPFLAVYLLGISVKKPMMGAGDVKLMAAIGALTNAVAVLWCIWFGLLVAFVWAVVALVVRFASRGRRREPHKVALGACLCIGAVLALLNDPRMFIRIMTLTGS